MEATFAPNEIIKKIKNLNKNCVIILGNEPVVSNHIKKDIRSFTDLNNIEHQSINLDTSKKLDQIKPLFENNSLFSSQTIFSISVASGRVSEDTKKFIVKVILENKNDFFIMHFHNNTKELLKSLWFKEIKDNALQLEAKEPSIELIQDAIKIRANFYKLNLDEESLSLLSNLTLGNLLAAENEIIKLSLLEIKTNIDAKQLISHISNGSKFDSFKLLDFCIAGHLNKTTQALSYFEEEGIEPLMLNGLFSWLFTAISKLKFSSSGPITNSKLMELRIFGNTQGLVRTSLSKLSPNQIEASLVKIKEIDLICKGIRKGDPWLEINRFAFGISRLFNKKTA
ncbi:DNA polymerase III subunit delta [Methylophilaceae bacterium]|jgi:DNA polymerase III subunit delta|nr:DNA polymerase III subunit delta [Methylophilaceae bacterium]|tara:strand:+ start:242 stop:1261 length:1020 start_codon:yes stop_codon:yes gene_type:complete